MRVRALLPMLLLLSGAVAAQPFTFGAGIGHDPSTLLRTAEARLHAGEVGAAAEMVAQARALVLTQTDSPARAGIIAATDAAGVALRADDRAAAGTQIALARTRLAAEPVGPDKAPAPMPVR